MKITTGLVTVFAIAFLGMVAGFTVIIITGHDGALYVTNLGILLTAVAGFVVTLRGQQKTQEDVETVKSNTNGTLSAVMAKLDSTQAKLTQALAVLPPDHAEDVLSTTITKPEAAAAVTEALPPKVD